MSTRSDWLVGVTLNTWENYTSDIVIDGQLVVHRRVFLSKDLDGTAASPAIAFGDGDSGWYESQDDILRVSIAGTFRGTWSSGGLYVGGNTAGNPYMLYEVASATNPVFAFVSDLDTGIGRAGVDQLSLIAGGVEKARFWPDGATITAVCHNDTVICNANEIVFT